MSFTTPLPSGATSYTGLTASMQADPEARHTGGAASVSSSRAFPIAEARCATHPVALEWVPDREKRVVPQDMIALCRRCPGRSSCLLWALTGREHGYWAGTTTADRERLRELGEDSIETADWVQELRRQEAGGVALHPAGEGSYWWYRKRRCHCAECRAANAAQRARERAKTRYRTVA